MRRDATISVSRRLFVVVHGACGYHSVVIEKESQLINPALERTFLGYLRTSLALSMTGAIIAQLFRLQDTDVPAPGLSYFRLGVPLAALFLSSAIFVVLLGAHRFWRQQSAMARGKVWAGGWEINAIMGLAVGLVVTVFVLLLLAGG